jgi:hypothetical protein
MPKKRGSSSMQWYTVDLHLHTPASSDYQQPDATYLDILYRAEARGLNAIALTDHNTVAGYRKIRDEMQQLELLEKLDRMMPEERHKLNEYRRLLGKIVVFPGFEFTATFGFHILGIFPPEKPLREIEHLLLDLNIPPDQLDYGSATVGATTDVLSAYQMIHEAGGLVIAAHANSSNGVAMRGFSFGGQTKIAYTQDPHLHALEVTDLELKTPRATAAFFNGTKPEYPRRMHCIQGSDCHRLSTDPVRKKNLGIGDRATDMLLPDLSFDSLVELFTSNDFARSRPHRAKAEPAYDFIYSAREEGSSIVQEFHESMTVRGGKRYAIIADVCAFANTNGGTIYIGMSDKPAEPVIGVPDPEQATQQLEMEISNRISPPLQCTVDVHEAGGKKILRVLVPRGGDPPYAVDENKIYVRSETETGLAVRDEIVSLVTRSPKLTTKMVEVRPAETKEPPVEIAYERQEDTAPRTGVEVVSVQERDGAHYYSMRDLRNGNVVQNVTRTSARRLWHYAITRYSALAGDLSKAAIDWQGNLGLISRQKQGNITRYDLVQRTQDGYRFFFGVTDDGVHGPWKQLLGHEDD